jgi:adenosylhomocysteine nucleosidase
MILFLFPLKAELDFFSKHFVFKADKFMGAFAGQGKVQFALTTQSLCAKHPEITAIFCLGSAGALEAELKPGDIVVGETSVEHDFKVLSRDVDLPAFSANPELYKSFEDLHAPHVYFGSIASGDEDVMSEERRREIYKLTGALCVAWEGAGGARAAKHVQRPFIEVRAITDLAQATTRQDFANHLELAMTALAQLMNRYVSAQ